MKETGMDERAKQRKVIADAIEHEDQYWGLSATLYSHGATGMYYKVTVHKPGGPEILITDLDNWRKQLKDKGLLD